MVQELLRVDMMPTDYMFHNPTPKQDKPETDCKDTEVFTGYILFIQLYGVAYNIKRECTW